MKYIIEVVTRRPERIKRATLSTEVAECVTDSFTKEFSCHLSATEIATEMLANVKAIL